MDYRIAVKPAFRVLAMTKKFDMESSSTEIPQFWNDFMAAGHQQYVCGTYGICHSYEENSFSYSIADDYQEGGNIPEGFEVIEIPQLNWAQFTCIGPMPTAIQAMWQKVYQEWLPASDYEVVPGFDLEMYSQGDINSTDYVSEIWIPVKRK